MAGSREMNAIKIEVPLLELEIAKGKVFKTKEGCEMVNIREKNVVAYVTRFCVLMKTGSVECTCRHFLRYGSMISEKYILRRWRSDIIQLALTINIKRYGEKLRFKPPSWTSENVIEDIDAVEQVTNAS
ncbi:hypothetical protein Tco_1144731 [Tanacetum coccineum]